MEGSVGLRPLLYSYSSVITAKPEKKKYKTAELNNGVDKVKELFAQGNNWDAIGKMEWVVIMWAKKQGYKADKDAKRPGRNILNKFLMACYRDIEKGRALPGNTTEYFKAYLPLHLIELTTGKEYLELIYENLPEEMLDALTPDEVASFICMALAVIHKESRFSNVPPEQSGIAGVPEEDWACGLMQVRPSTAGLSREELEDPETNLGVGLSYLYKQFKINGEYDFEYKSVALAGYSSGPSRSNELKNGLYARSVRARYRVIKALYFAEIVDLVYSRQ